jgi:hypothetical protein
MDQAVRRGRIFVFLYQRLSLARPDYRRDLFRLRFSQIIFNPPATAGGLTFFSYGFFGVSSKISSSSRILTSEPYFW